MPPPPPRPPASPPPPPALPPHPRRRPAGTPLALLEQPEQGPCSPVGELHIPAPHLGGELDVVRPRPDPREGALRGGGAGPAPGVAVHAQRHRGDRVRELGLA